MCSPSQDQLTLRLAAPDDAPRIARLAALDSARPPSAPQLLAELDRELIVAVSLVDLATVADPFRLTAEVRDLAQARARQLRERRAGDRDGAVSRAPRARTRVTRRRAAAAARP